MTKANQVFRPIENVNKLKTHGTAKTHPGSPNDHHHDKHHDPHKTHEKHHHHHHHHHDKNPAPFDPRPHKDEHRRESLPEVMIMTNQHKHDAVMMVDNGNGEPGEKRVFSANGALLPPKGYDDRHVKKYGNNAGPPQPEEKKHKEHNAGHTPPPHHKRKLGEHHNKHNNAAADKNHKHDPNTPHSVERIAIAKRFSKKLNEKFNERKHAEKRTTSPKGACLSFLATIAVGVVVIILL